jgi:hypothetical protein
MELVVPRSLVLVSRSQERDEVLLLDPSEQQEQSQEKNTHDHRSHEHHPLTGTVTSEKVKSQGQILYDHFEWPQK